MTDSVTENIQEFEELESVAIRFAGDSGDGMQLTGTQFTTTSAVFGNDISTMPDFPAEIRAPAGTLAGVSGFQVHFSSQNVLTPGDAPQVLVAMNPAALKASLPELQRAGTIIVNTDSFTKQNLSKAGYSSNPLEDNSLEGYQVLAIPMTSLNREALAGFTELTNKERDRCQNFFALGMVFWMFDRSMETTREWLFKKFARKPVIAEANLKAMETGYFLGETTETFQHRYMVRPAALPPGTYRKVTGNEALAMGLVTAAHKMGKPLFYGSYPITPASDILHSLASLRHFDVRTFQAEDEIAAICAVIGAAFGGALAVTGTSGPGIALKSEADQPGAHAGTADDCNQCTAGGTQHGAADEDGTGRSVAGDVRAQRRKPDPDRCAGDAFGLFRDGAGSGAAGGAGDDAGHPAVGRVSGEQRGTVAGAQARKIFPRSR